MNRAERRALERQGQTPPARATAEDAKRLIDEAFEDRISWTAARVILTRVQGDPAFGELNPQLQGSIRIFLERHPEPEPRP